MATWLARRCRQVVLNRVVLVSQINTRRGEGLGLRIGGLVSATLFTVFVLPVLYTIVLPDRAARAPRRLEPAPFPEVA